jgi:8-oxo-dGTP pyrophosphatase MutT (NUDIX family)
MADDTFPERIEAILAQHAPTTIAEWEARPAAVLVPLFLKDGEWHLLFTLRTETVQDHKGQISFPGGRCDPEDPSPLATALREAHEEIGLDPADVTVLGQLNEMYTVTQYRISPFVGVFPYPYRFHTSAAEIAELIEVPLSALLNPANFEQRNRAVLVGPPVPVYFYHVGGYTIWGVTARIVKDFLDKIASALELR